VGEMSATYWRPVWGSSSLPRCKKIGSTPDIQPRPR
jgi:hypothetical protein